ncbi:PAS domain-containing sensor histidine kinase [Candidatus Bathyarchaeota archaeon]|nr:MAG: PAS domain-containing sensor histidine kinase [Candidatus Bathyarchaeota archaeon]
MIESCRDITERKKAEEAIKASEEKFKTLAEQSPNMIFVNKKGRVVYANKKCVDAMGYKKEEFFSPDFDFLSLISPEHLDLIKANFIRHMKDEDVAPYEYTLVTKEGKSIEIVASTKLIRYDGENAILGILTDITERKKAEEAIRVSREKFEQLFINNPEAAVYMDSGFHILDINPRFTKLFGYSLGEVKGKHINSLVVPEDRVEEAERFDKKASQGETYQEDTVRKRKDGTSFPVSLSAAPIIVETKVAGYVAVYKDISSLKRAEEKLKMTLEKVHVLNEKLGVVGKLTRHDVRNKLSTVLGNAFLARRKVGGDPEGLEHLSEIELAIHQVERIFDFAKTYETLGTKELVHVDVGKIVEKAVSLFSDLHGAIVRNDCHGLTVLADSLLQQLIYNLIHNSLQHGERVSLIGIRYEVEDDGVKLVYEDDGVGIPKAEKEKIFQKGYGKDTGYGLYLIRRMCEVYGWIIKETGKAGKGAQFTMTIPRLNESGQENYSLPQVISELQA